ncbi:LptE family protein [Pedobacter caeni]|uniref:Lipopolysaccharide-assembly n=1 Tax=Pedobacter caeni TaxID=288992 RepID=A0A1M5DAM7_9SPHI|nr:LptE family protein [Pedobacter caeni]SHF64069.1 Lipopolysaccharide-assembly [Pedobacter caeni]
MKKLYFLLVIAVFSSCSIKLSGDSIPPEMKTVNITFFENNAPLVVPYMSNDFTENLRNRIRSQTKLNLTTNDAHGIFSGTITGYDIRPTNISDANNRGQVQSGTNRMTIRVTVKYTNNLDPKQSFEEAFERFKDFPTAGQNFQAQEKGLINEVLTLLTEDIFNRAFANW